VACLPYLLTLKMEAVRSSETPVGYRALHSTCYRCENLKSNMNIVGYQILQGCTQITDVGICPANVCSLYNDDVNVYAI
jgi:hypothetical protein